MAERMKIHFDGPVTKNHRVSLRNLGSTLDRLQNMIDRAYLDLKYGNVYKHARLKKTDYKDAEFLVMDPSEGGYILEFASETHRAAEILARIVTPIGDAVALAKADVALSKDITFQLATRRVQIEREILKVRTYKDLIDQPDKATIRRYGDRSIVKELDQILGIVRNKASGDSYFELIFLGSNSTTFTFNRDLANRFHQVISRKELGEPVVYTGSIRSLDRGSPYAHRSGKFTNKATGRDFSLHINTKQDFDELSPYLKADETEITIVGCPLIEYGAFDPNAGDVYFVQAIEETL